MGRRPGRSSEDRSFRFAGQFARNREALAVTYAAKESPAMRVSAFIEPCLPSPADCPPSGSGWIHEIKLDGFRMMVRRDPAGVRPLTRNGHDWTGRFPLIAEAAGMLRARSFL